MSYILEVTCTSLLTLVPLSMSNSWRNFTKRLKIDIVKLIKFEDYQIHIADEALLVKQFRRLFNMDRSGGKEQFYKQMSILFFCYSPASNYSYITDEKERLKEVCEQEGITDFKMTPEMKNAIEVYKKLCQTPESLLLESTYRFIDKSRKTLDELNYDDLEDAKEKVNTMKVGMSIVALIPKLMKDLSAAKTAVEKEMEEQTSARGSQELTILDSDI